VCHERRVSKLRCDTDGERERARERERAGGGGGRGRESAREAQRETVRAREREIYWHPCILSALTKLTRTEEGSPLARIISGIERTDANELFDKMLERIVQMGLWRIRGGKVVKTTAGPLLHLHERLQEVALTLVNPSVFYNGIP